MRQLHPTNTRITRMTIDITKAKFKTTCPKCPTEINPGDIIVKTQSGWIHSKCWSSQGVKMNTGKFKPTTERIICRSLEGLIERAIWRYSQRSSLPYIYLSIKLPTPLCISNQVISTISSSHNPVVLEHRMRTIILHPEPITIGQEIPELIGKPVIFDLLEDLFNDTWYLRPQHLRVAYTIPLSQEEPQIIENQDDDSDIIEEKLVELCDLIEEIKDLAHHQYHPDNCPIRTIDPEINYTHHLQSLIIFSGGDHIWDCRFCGKEEYY